MWFSGFDGPMEPYFESVKRAASNISSAGERGGYTTEIFIEDFPQFSRIVADRQGNRSACLVPDSVMQIFVDQANGSVLPSRWGSLWRYAAGLYVAHFSAMYLKTYAPYSSSISQVVAGSQQTGAVKSATLGDTSVSYDNSAITAGTEKWGSWNATQYGQQLVTLARQVGMGGMYVI